MKELFRHGILSDEEASELIRRMRRGDPHARSTLIAHHHRFVASIAHKFDNTGIPFEDLFSIGMVGLIKGIDTFDPAKKRKVVTYVGRCVENEILLFLRKGRKIKEVSLNQVIGIDLEGNEFTLSDILSTEEDISHDVEIRSDNESLHGLIDRLSDRDRMIIELRFGLNGKEAHTQKKIAEIIGVKQSYVSRIIKRILVKLEKRIYL